MQNTYKNVKNKNNNKTCTQNATNIPKTCKRIKNDKNMLYKQMQKT